MADTDKPTTALTARKPAAPAPTAYEPQDFPQAMQMAATLGKAAGLTPEVAYLKMAAGADYGIPAVTALRLIDIIDGPGGTKQPAPRAQLMVALCLRAPDVIEYFERVTSDEKQATWRGKRVGRPEQVVTYTVDMAKKAKLIKDGGAWEKDPESQCNARASARLARLIASDVIGGMVAAEERGDIDTTPEPVQPLPQTAGIGSTTEMAQEKARAAAVDAEWEPAHDPVTGEVKDAPSGEQPMGKAIRLLGTCRDDAGLVAAREACQAVWPKMADAPADVQTLWKEAKARVEAIKKEGAK